MEEASLKQLLRGNHRSLLMVIDALPFPVYYKDKEGTYLGCNRFFEKFVGEKRENIIGKNVFAFFEETSANIFNASDLELLEEPGIQIYETSFQRADGTTTYAKFEKSTFMDENGEVAGLIGAIIDISKEKKLEARLKRLASYDDLTGIYNRREGRKRLKSLCKDAVRKSRPLSVMLIDLDNFKFINDTYGHDTGDLILKNAADCFTECSRENDVVCRYGGEEFLVVLPETSKEDAINIANRFREALSASSLQMTSAESLSVTASFGISELDLDFTDRELMLKQADMALYRAKDQGKNRVCH